jgi:hypothetical protein
MKYLLFLAALPLFWSCANSDSSTATTEEDTLDVIHFGEEITADEAVSYEQLLDMMKEASEVTLKVRGRVQTVCQTKGCWMTVGSDNPVITELMFVQFEDYGFFMPKNLAGAEVVMAGKAYRETTSVEELRHYAEDEGKSAAEIAAITEPEEEIKFMATGVVIVR